MAATNMGMQAEYLPIAGCVLPLLGLMLEYNPSPWLNQAVDLCAVVEVGG